MFIPSATPFSVSSTPGTMPLIPSNGSKPRTTSWPRPNGKIPVTQDTRRVDQQVAKSVHQEEPQFVSAGSQRHSRSGRTTAEQEAEERKHTVGQHSPPGRERARL